TQTRRAAEVVPYRLLSRNAVNCDLVSAPTFCACACPALYRITVGMPRMPYLPGVDGLASMSSLATVTLPPYSLATSSRTGAKSLQGPHHSAQKWTRTGLPDCRTSLSNVASETCLMASLMENPLVCGRRAKKVG